MKNSLLALLALLLPFSASAASIPQGAQRVNFGMFTITAPCTADSMIESVILKHSGLGDTEDVDRVYLTEGNKRLTSARSISTRDRTVELRLRGLRIAKCTTRTFSILADFSGDAAFGGEHRIDVVSVRTGRGTAAIAAGSDRTDSTRAVPATTGTITVEYRDLLRSVLYGKNRTLARISLSAEGEDQQISSIVFTNDGSARNADLQNLRLFDGDELLAPVVKNLDGDTLRFELDSPLLLDRNQSKLLTVKGDVRASRKRTIRFIIDEPSDIEAMRQQRSR